jgi:hypothetical protein
MGEIPRSFAPRDDQLEMNNTNNLRLHLIRLTHRANYSTARDDTAPQVRKEFTAKAGEVVELGDLRIDHPRFAY